METKTGEQNFLAETTIERNGQRIKVRAYPPPPDSQGKPRYIVRNQENDEVVLNLEEKMLFDQLIFGKPEPEDVYTLEQQQQPLKKRRKTKP